MYQEFKDRIERLFAACGVRPESADRGSRYITPFRLVIRSPETIIQALEAVARGRQVALFLPYQVPDPMHLPWVPPRPLRAYARWLAWQIIALRPVRGDVATIYAAAELFGVADWPASIWSQQDERGPNSSIDNSPFGQPTATS